MSVTHRAVWFEIPVSNIERARHFYQQALQLPVGEANACPSGVPDLQMAVFGHEAGSVSGALVQSPDCQPGSSGSIVYLNAGDDLQAVLDRLPAAGGKVVVGKTAISPEIGYFAQFRDTEGNTVGLHSPH